MIYGFKENSYSFDLSKKTATFSGETFKCSASLIMDLSVLDRTDSTAGDVYSTLIEAKRQDICESDSYSQCLSF